MAATKKMVKVRPATNDKDGIAAAAVTASLAFSDDPVISWLYRDDAPFRWNSLHSDVLKWQEHRARNPIPGTITIEAVVEQDDNDASPRSVGFLCLVPPQPSYGWLRPWWWSSYIYNAFQHVVLAPKEPCCDDARSKIMMERHSQFGIKASGLYPEDLWYLPVVAVTPDSQGMGVGSSLLKAGLELVGNSPVYLECTNLANVKLYEKYGFEVCEEAVLKDEKKPEHQVTVYYMIRKAT
ncbi:hypothetical protein BX600DRAFT_517200 [Xylariales sp. PMI_506]|nr:hypothetical protein BX600DRAFT_517200 [Xylariales sp. PMI_506]